MYHNKGSFVASIFMFYFYDACIPHIENNAYSTTPLKLVSLTHTSKVSQVVLNDVKYRKLEFLLGM